MTSLLGYVLSLGHIHSLPCIVFFFLNDAATTEIYTLSLHDALPIYAAAQRPRRGRPRGRAHRQRMRPRPAHHVDRKSTRLNSSHTVISYAVFCLKKKNRAGARTTPTRSTPTPAGFTLRSETRAPTAS